MSLLLTISGCPDNCLPGMCSSSDGCAECAFGYYLTADKTCSCKYTYPFNYCNFSKNISWF